MFENILKEMVGQTGAEITGRAVLPLVEMVALLVEMTVALAEMVVALLAEMVVALLVGMVVALLVRTVVDLLVGTVVALLVEATEVAEEDLRERKPLGMLQPLDGRTLQRGQTEPLLPQV